MASKKKLIYYYVSEKKSLLSELKMKYHYREVGIPEEKPKRLLKLYDDIVEVYKIRSPYPHCLGKIKYV